MTVLGISLLLLGAALVVIEAHVPTLGVLGGPGVIALVVGAVLAVSGLGGGLGLGVRRRWCSPLLDLGLAVMLRKGIAVRRRRVRPGPRA